VARRLAIAVVPSAQRFWSSPKRLASAEAQSPEIASSSPGTTQSASVEKTTQLRESRQAAPTRSETTSRRRTTAVRFLVRFVLKLPVVRPCHASPTHEQLARRREKALSRERAPVRSARSKRSNPTRR
jgi:hypothetical protein